MQGGVEGGVADGCEMDGVGLRVGGVGDVVGRGGEQAGADEDRGGACSLACRFLWEGHFGRGICIP